MLNYFIIDFPQQNSILFSPSFHYSHKGYSSGTVDPKIQVCTVPTPISAAEIYHMIQQHIRERK